MNQEGMITIFSIKKLKMSKVTMGKKQQQEKTSNEFILGQNQLIIQRVQQIQLGERIFQQKNTFHNPLSKAQKPTKMISLQDKITKFQKLLYNKQLEDFIPIDQQFIGGGITMDSLIKQNAFIVDEMKKIKNVFNNYCKLNQTVYEKIIQHQLSLHSETNKIINISQAISNKLDDSLGQVKHMYEEMQHQSTKTQQFVHETIKPIQQAVNKKVDESSFTFHMRKIINQIQYGQISVEEDQKSQSSPLQFEEPNDKKRRSKFISHEEYQLQKENMNKVLFQLSSQIQKIQGKNQQNEEILYRNTVAVNKINLTVDNNQNQIFKIKRQAKDALSLIHTIQQRLLDQISQRTSDDIWQKKLVAFQTDFITPKYQYLTNEIHQYKKQSNRLFGELQLKLKPIQQNIQRLFQENKSQFNLISHHKQQYTKTTQKIYSHFLKVQQNINSLKQSSNNKQNQINEKINSETSLRNKQILLLNNKIKDLTKNIEEQVFATVKKNIQAKITQIDQNIHSLKTKQQRIDQQLFQTNGEIQSIKQVVSKKANFTDILMHFQKKADKEDIKELKQKIQTSPSHLKTTLLESVEKTRRTISANSRKRPNVSKNLLNVSNILNEDKCSMASEREMSSRLFIMGLENDMGLQSDRRMSCTESTRMRKRIKSTVATLKLLS